MSNELSRAGNGEVDLSGTAASGTSTEIGTFTIGGGEVAMNLEIVNQGGNALSGFAIQCRQRPGGPWLAYMSDSDFEDNLIDAIRFCSSGGLDSLAAGGEAKLDVTIPGYEARFLATGSGGTAAVRIRGLARRSI
jgi:hypothetical protein